MYIYCIYIYICMYVCVCVHMYIYMYVGVEPFSGRVRGAITNLRLEGQKEIRKNSNRKIVRK